jgi:hypothetical protein
MTTNFTADHRAAFDYAITPLFVSLTPSLELTDHDGRAPET